MLIGDPLTVELIAENQFGFAVGFGLPVVQVVAAGPQLFLHASRTGLDPLGALPGELVISDGLRHSLGDAQLRQVQAADVRRHAAPARLWRFEPFRALIAGRHRNNAIADRILRPQIHRVDHVALDHREEFLGQLLILLAVTEQIAVDHRRQRDAVGRPLVAFGWVRKVDDGSSARATAEDPNRGPVGILIALVASQRGQRQLREEVDQRLVPIKRTRDALDLGATARALVHAKQSVLLLNPVGQGGLLAGPHAVFGDQVQVVHQRVAQPYG